LSNAGGIAIVCNVGRFWISSGVSEIFAVKVGCGQKLTEILHVFWPPIFWEERPPNFWSGIIKLGQIPTMSQSFRAIGRGSSENAWRKKTSAAEYKPVRNGGSGRPKNELNQVVVQSTTNLAPCCDVAKGQKQQFHYIFSR